MSRQPVSEPVPPARRGFDLLHEIYLTVKLRLEAIQFPMVVINVKAGAGNVENRALNGAGEEKPNLPDTHLLCHVDTACWTR